MLFWPPILEPSWAILEPSGAILGRHHSKMTPNVFQMKHLSALSCQESEGFAPRLRELSALPFSDKTFKCFAFLKSEGAGVRVIRTKTLDSGHLFF